MCAVPIIYISFHPNAIIRFSKKKQKGGGTKEQQQQQQQLLLLTDIDVNQTKKGGDGDAREKRTANLLVFDEDTREERAKMSKTDKGSECALMISSSPPSEKKKSTPTSATTHAKADTEEEEEEEEEDILGTDMKREKSERSSPEAAAAEEKKANEERAAREANVRATTSSGKSVLELHFGKRKPNPPKEFKFDQKPKEADPSAEPLPEELEEWKQFAEQQLADLVNLMRQKIIDCFHVRLALSVMMIACPARELREVLKDLRDMKVVGNTMRPYLIYLREILDGCGEKYRDKLDADMEFSSSDDESSSDEEEDNADDADQSDSEEIPEITRGDGPLSKTAKVRGVTKIQGCSSSDDDSDNESAEDDGNSSSLDSEEEEEEEEEKKPKYDRQRCQLFSKFLGRFMIENRVQEQVEAARLLQADGCREFSDEECVQFLDLLQRQGKIMIDGPNIHVI